MKLEVNSTTDANIIINRPVAESATYGLTFRSLTTAPASIDLAAVKAITTDLGVTPEGQLGLYTYGSAAGALTERVRIDQNGNVGIGTTGPGYPLHIVKDGTFVNSASGVLVVGGATDTTEVLSLGYDTTNDFGYIFAADVGSSYDDLVLQPAGGNVGIGTTAPGAKLEVAGDTILGADSGADKLFINDYGNNYAYITAGDIDRDKSVGLDFQYRNSAGALADGMKIQSDGDIEIMNGNVGIGTTAPGAKLHVSGTSSALEIIEGSGISGWLRFDEAGTTRGYLGYGDAGQLFTDQLTDSIALRAQNALQLGSGTGADLTIDTNGNVGIGTTAPNTMLEIAGTSNQLRLAYSSSYYTNLTIDSAGMLTVAPNGTTAATFSQSANTFTLPTSFTAAGDVSIAYDLQFTNQTAAYVKSDGPLTIQSGESFENLDLTLDPSGTGAVVVASGSDLELATSYKVVFDNVDTGDSYMKHDTTNNWLTVFTDGTEVARFKSDGAIDANAAVNANAFDLAENYPTMDTALEPGDVVELYDAEGELGDAKYLVKKFDPASADFTYT